MAASSPGGHSHFKDHTRPFSSTTAGTRRRSTSFQQDRYQVAFGPGGRGVSPKPRHWANPGGARHPHLTFVPGRPASGRAVPITTSHQSTAESVVSLAVCKEKEEGRLSSRGGGSRGPQHAAAVGGASSCPWVSPKLGRRSRAQAPHQGSSSCSFVSRSLHHVQPKIFLPARCRGCRSLCATLRDCAL